MMIETEKGEEEAISRSIVVTMMAMMMMWKRQRLARVFPHTL